MPTMSATGFHPSDNPLLQRARVICLTNIHVLPLATNLIRICSFIPSPFPKDDVFLMEPHFPLMGEACDQDLGQSVRSKLATGLLLQKVLGLIKANETQ